jgi:hypothetical protein
MAAKLYGSGEYGRRESQGWLVTSTSREDFGFGKEDIGVLAEAIVRRQGVDGSREVFWPMILRESCDIEVSNEVGRFWCSIGVHWVRLQGLEIEAVEEFPFFSRAHERVFHKLIEGLETLHIYPDGVLVALFRSIESVRFCKAQSS